MRFPGEEMMEQAWLGDGLLDYRPRPAPLFRPAQVVLARGSDHPPWRRQLAERICAAYPEAQVIEALDTAHNHVALGVKDPFEMHCCGKRTLVLGELGECLHFSEERGNACPNYWHFSPYWFCPYGCTYCYLAGTPGVYFSPTVKIFFNLAHILQEIDQEANAIGRPTAFYVGKLQDGLALDPLCGYSRLMVPFFARHPHARLVVLTKSAEVRNLLGLDHGGNTILSWSLNPPEVSKEYEPNTPAVEDRLGAMQQCAEAGYPIRAVLMPILKVPDWEGIYRRFLVQLLDRFCLERITLGCICSYSTALHFTELKLGKHNLVSCSVERSSRRCGDGRRRYPWAERERVYGHLIGTIRQRRPELPIALCLEDRAMFAATGIEGNLGQCNCVL